MVVNSDAPRPSTRPSVARPIQAGPASAVEPVSNRTRQVVAAGFPLVGHSRWVANDELSPFAPGPHHQAALPAATEAQQAGTLQTLREPLGPSVGRPPVKSELACHYRRCTQRRCDFWAIQPPSPGPASYAFPFANGPKATAAAAPYLSPIGSDCHCPDSLRRDRILPVCNASLP